MAWAPLASAVLPSSRGAETVVADLDLPADLPLTPEFRLLLTCGRIGTGQEKQAAIGALLTAEFDWTVFSQNAVEHGVVSLAAQTLLRLAPDLVPSEMLDAFQAIKDATTKAGAVMFHELVRLIAGLTGRGIEAICFKGPVLAVQAYGDLGSREFSDLDFLVRDEDLAETIAALCELGYRRLGQLTASQFHLIHRLQGQEIIISDGTGITIEPHTRLTSLKFALNIDYAALWGRSVRNDIRGCTFQTFAPEDDLLVLAIHGAKETWRKLKWAYDIAAFIASHPQLDWGAAVERAGAQGCVRMLLLATSLARRCLGATVPTEIIAAEQADPLVDQMVRRIVQRWQSEGPTESVSNRSISMDRLRLHDGVVRQARYVARTLLLPGPHHVAAVPLPRHLAFGYIPFKFVHDLVALPLWQSAQILYAALARLPYTFAGSKLALAVIPAPAATKQNVRRYQQARATAKRALERNRADPGAWRDLGNALYGLGRIRRAVACYDRALSLAPGDMATWRRRAAALRATGAPTSPPDDPLDPQDAGQWSIRARRLFSSGHYLEAIEASERALVLDPGDSDALRIGIQARLQTCDWRQRDADKIQVAEALEANQQLVARLYHRSLSDSEAANLRLAQISYPGSIRTLAALWRGEQYHHDKIRVAYVLPELRVSMVSTALATCLAHHDRSRIEVTAVALAPEDAALLRGRLTSASDRLVVVGDGMADYEVAQRLHELETDILIAVTSDMANCRLWIPGHRPAPVQVNFPDHGGTSGLPFLDYIIADHIVIPESNRDHYVEQIAYMPHFCVPPDSARPIGDTNLSRLEVGLPATGFVFVCREPGHKISPAMFEVWMRVLKAVDDSVLWFGSVLPVAMNNLRREAASRGVAPERLVTGKPGAQANDRLARFRLADLVLDTRPQNGNLAVCDALSSGIPVLTCPGSTSCGRIAASLLRAMNMPELVASSLADYETIAIELASDQHRLAAVRAKLMRNREGGLPFGIGQFTRDLESAYTTMWRRQQDGSQPTTFSVE